MQVASVVETPGKDFWGNAVKDALERNRTFLTVTIQERLVCFSL